MWIQFRLWDGQSRLLVPEHGIGAGWSEGIERTNEGMRLPGLSNEVCYPKRVSSV